MIPIEVKHSDNISKQNLKAIKVFIQKQKLSDGLVTTRSIFDNRDGIWVIPNWFLLLFKEDEIEKWSFDN